MSQREATTCKLPLLDGEDTNTARLTVVESDLQSLERPSRFGTGDEASLNELLCTAWGLVLRCYTGQETVSFQFRQSICDDVISNPTVSRIHQSTYRVLFDEEESLSSCFAKAKDGFVDLGNERGNPSLSSAASDSASLSTAEYMNTSVWIQGKNCKDTQDVIVEKVFKPGLIARSE